VGKSFFCFITIHTFDRCLIVPCVVSSMAKKHKKVQKELPFRIHLCISDYLVNKFVEYMTREAYAWGSN